MSNSQIIGHQLASRLLYKNQEIAKINLTQIYIELTQFVKASSKLTLAHHSLYCYFEDASFDKSCKIGVHVTGWETQVDASDYSIKDFNELGFRRVQIKILPKLSLKEQLQAFYGQHSLETDTLWRLSCDFDFKNDGLEILTYLDFFNLVK